MEVGKRIEELRGKRGYSQNRLAEWQTHLRRVELGEADITVGHLRLICDALGISLKDFFSESDETDEITAAVSAFSVKQRKLLSEFLKSL